MKIEEKIDMILGEEEMKDLGDMNSWSKTPDIVKHCRDKHHQMHTRNKGRCYNEYSCPICKYRYAVDSGD